MQSLQDLQNDPNSNLSSAFYKPYQHQTDLNLSAGEDDIAMEVPKTLGQTYKDASGDPMEVDEEPHTQMSPNSKL